jgi:oxaloacetate decarboxylase beta subunit
MEMITETLGKLWQSSGFARLGQGGALDTVGPILMILLSFVLLYLGIVKKFEPLLLVGIAFGMLLTNLPGAGLYHPELWDAVMSGAASYGDVLKSGGLLDILYIGVKAGIYPCLIFLGVGAMTDFGPLLANPKSMILGAAAQLGVYCAFILAITLGFSAQEAAATGIIGGADGPTAIYLASKMAPHLLGPIAIAAYSYMALIPLIQPPIMRALTTPEERACKMEQLRTVTKREKILFPIAVTAFTALLLPSVAPLLGCLMLGNLLTECGVTARLSDTAQNALMNIVTIFLAVSVGATTGYARFLQKETLYIIGLGLLAFAFSTTGGVLLGKLMYKITGGKINPLIGSAGVSAVPMAARVSQVEGQKANPSNFLLMHAMGPNVAGVIGSAVAAGFFLAAFGG